jgi:hypothetical protein
MADDTIKKTVEISFVVDQGEFTKGVQQAQDKLGEVTAARAKETRDSAGSKRVQALRERVQAVHSKRDKRDTAQAKQKELNLANQIKAASAAHTAELRKQTAEIQKQVTLMGKLRSGQKGAHAGALAAVDGGGGGGGRGGGGASPGLMGRMGGMAKRTLFALPAAAMAGIMGIAGAQIRRSYQAFVEAELEQAKLQTFTLDRAGYDAAVQPGYNLGYTRAETARQAGAIARSTGRVGDVTFAQQVSRSAVGMGVGEAGDMMGTFARAGQGGFGEGGRGKREFEMVLARGFESGLDRSRMPEFMQSVGTLVERQSGISAGDVTGANAARLLSFFGKSGLSGLQGERGGKVLSKLDQAIRKPGGGPDGEALMMRAFGFGTPGGTAGFMEARRRMQQGITGKGGVKNLIDMVTQTEKEYGGGEGSTFVLERLTGLSMEQVEAVRERVAKLRAGGGDEKAIRAEIKKFAEKAAPIEEQVLKANQTGFTDTKVALASINEHLVKLGGDYFKPIHHIQESINKMMESFHPQVLTFLKGVADSVKALEHFVVGEPDPETVAMAAGDRKFKDIMSLERQYEAGDIGYGDYKKKLDKIIMDLQAQRGTVQTSGFSDLMGMLGFDVGGHEQEAVRSQLRNYQHQAMQAKERAKVREEQKKNAGPQMSLPPEVSDALMSMPKVVDNMSSNVEGNMSTVMNHSEAVSRVPNMSSSRANMSSTIPGMGD